MTVETPQPRDRARWQRTSVIEGVVEEITSDGLNIRAEDGQLHLCQVEDATVEVLERADDPSKDQVGTVRRSPDGKVVAKGSRINFPWANLSAPKGDDSYHSNAVAGWPVIGAVPGTPAAANDPAEFMRKITKVFRRPGESDADYQTRMVREGEAHEADGGVVHLGAFGDCEKCTPRPSVRVPNEPHGPSPEVRERVAELVRVGNIPEAVKAVKAATHWLLDDAHQYVREMAAEYKAFLSEQGRTEVDPTEDRALIQSVLDERTTEYVYGQDDGSWKLDGTALAGVVTDIVWAAIRRDRERGGR